MLDSATLEVTFSAITLIVFVLTYFFTYRHVRSKYSAWWCTAILMFLAGSSSYLLTGTGHQIWAIPAANALLVAGATSVWAGARTLRTTSPSPWWLVAPPILAALATALGHPAVDVWAGGAFFLFLMALMFGSASTELWRLTSGVTRLHKPMSLAACVLAVYYLGRTLALLTIGPEAETFVVFFSSAPTALLTMVVLVVAAFSMTALNTEQVTRDLQTRATHDALTGLLNRSGFADLAQEEIRRVTRAGLSGSLILADIDHFKTINDAYGHAAGDDVLSAYAAACKATVRSTDLVGRYGGEEFILLLPGAPAEHAQSIAHQISAALQAMRSPNGHPWPTISYGIASITPETSALPTVIVAADAALYEAKAQGRNRCVLARGCPPVLLAP